MKHLREEEEMALERNQDLPSIPEDKSNLVMFDEKAEVLDVMDPSAQGAYADTPVPPSVLTVSRISPAGPASSFSPQVSSSPSLVFPVVAFMMELGRSPRSDFPPPLLLVPVASCAVLPAND